MQTKPAARGCRITCLALVCSFTKCGIKLLSLGRRLTRFSRRGLRSMLVLDQFHVDAAESDLAADLNGQAPLICGDPNSCLV